MNYDKKLVINIVLLSAGILILILTLFFIPNLILIIVSTGLLLAAALMYYRRRPSRWLGVVIYIILTLILFTVFNRLPWVIIQHFSEPLGTVIG